MKLGEALYKAQQEAAEAAGAADDAGAADGADADNVSGKSEGGADVVDADFEEVDEKDRNKSA